LKLQNPDIIQSIKNKLSDIKNVPQDESIESKWTYTKHSFVNICQEKLVTVMKRNDEYITMQLAVIGLKNFTTSSTKLVTNLHGKSPQSKTKMGNPLRRYQIN
jgi:hypothetical protein